MKQPLEDVRVVDLSRVLAGPYCTMMLGDLGAEVVKIEMPGCGDDTRQWGPPWAGGESAYYLFVNRNKKSVTLNLKNPKAREILLRLIERGDILVENFKAGTMEKLGLGYDRLKEINPGLVYCSITGYGQDGPYANRPGYDFIIQAQGGIMSVTGEAEGEPMKVGVAIVDVTAGLYAASAVLAALRYREKTGQGQRIDISLLEAQLGWLANVASNYLVSKELPKRYGNAHPNVVPYETFKARDIHIAVGVGNDTQYRRFCVMAGCEHLADDARFGRNPKRIENRKELIPLLQEVFGQRDADEWLSLLVEAGIPCAPINTLDRVFSDPQVLYRKMVEKVQHPTAGEVELVASPLKLVDTPPVTRHHPPLLGENTEEILTRLLNYTREQIQDLRAEGAV
ncbi:MAG: CoA transferase [Chloroflexi bacterium]|nr:CoA transferase [Chloroflexota bacterium]